MRKSVSIIVLFVLLSALPGSGVAPLTDLQKFCMGRLYAGADAPIITDAAPCPAGSAYRLVFGYEGAIHFMIVPDWDAVRAIRANTSVSLYLLRVVDAAALTATEFGYQPGVAPWDDGFVMPVYTGTVQRQRMESCPVVPAGMAVTVGRAGDWNPYLPDGVSGNDQVLRSQPTVSADVTALYPYVAVGTRVRVLSAVQFTIDDLVFQEVRLLTGERGYLATCRFSVGEMYMTPEGAHR